ncbi:MAG: cell wall-binding repeat-containing protein [Solirubrobacteraceae bacterium]
MHRRPLANSTLRRRRLVSAALVTTGALATGAPAPAGADIRVSANTPLRPGADVVYGRDALGLAANPKNPRHIVAVYADWVSLDCETAVSTDAGRTWRRSRLKAPAGFADPPCTVGNHLANQLDGGIAFGRGNSVYVTFATGTVRPDGNGSGKSVLLAKSTDGGRSYGTGTVVLPGGEDADLGPDYIMPKLAVSPGSSSSTDRIYIAASGAGNESHDGVQGEDTVFTSSGDGGKTWTGPRIANVPDDNSIEHSGPTLGHDGAVYVAWRTRGKDPANPGKFVPEGTLVVGRTTDLGTTWTRTIVAGVRGFVYTGPLVAPFTFGTRFTASTFPRLASNPSNGDVYLVYGNGGSPLVPGTAVAADHFIDPDMDVYFQRSTDDARTWSLPERLNKDAPAQFEFTQTRHPTLSVAPNGRVDVVWQDRRHWYRGCTHTHAPCAEARLGDTYLRSSRNEGRSFGSERRITDRSMNNDIGFDYRFGAYWDYGPKSIPLGNDKVLVGWMDSRDGNVETDTMGIYLAQVNLKASRKVPVRRVTRSDAADLAVKLSQMTYPGGAEATLAGTFATAPASRVVIVNERDVAGALAAGVLARANLGPVLLAPSNGLSESVKAELTRLAPIGAYVIGATRSLSDRVTADLAATGIAQDQIVRIAGNDVADTAARIATAMDRRTAAEQQAGARAFDGAVIVNPSSPDAAAIAVLAANRRLPVLFVGANAIPASTAGALSALAIKNTIVVGSSRWVGDGLLAGLPKPQRLGGRDAVATSRAILAESRRRGLPSNIVYTARASRRMDAALLGPAVGRMTGLLLLTHRGQAEVAGLLDALRMRGAVDRVVAVDGAGRRGR